jgi:DNA-binding response OmpR family regulator
LVKNKGEILDRNAALRHVWGDDNYFNGRSMDVYITKLRKHIKPSEKLEILNVHGKGFKLLVKE